MPPTNMELATPVCGVNATCCVDEVDAETRTLWNATAAGTTASIICDFTPFTSSKSNTISAVRVCDANGQWLDPDYSLCIAAIRSDLSHSVLIGRVLAGVYVIGGAISMVLLSIALFIFCFFKTLHCTRIWIHCNLVVALIMHHIFLLIRLRDVLPFILMTNSMQESFLESRMAPIYRSVGRKSADFEIEEASVEIIDSVTMVTPEVLANSTYSTNLTSADTGATIEIGEAAASEVWCKIESLVLWYTFLCPMCWMFVEAAYLCARILFSVFSGEDNLFRFLCIFGWTLPLLIIIITAIILQIFYKVPCWDGVITSDFGWFICGPFLALLIFNVIFASAIVAVLIIKMKGMKNAETAQIRVALRAIVFLMPLFGLTYGLMVAAPSAEFVDIYRILNAVLPSLQGSSVALMYCFINQEVQGVIRSRWIRFQTVRNPSLQCAEPSLVNGAPRNSRIKATMLLPSANPDSF